MTIAPCWRHADRGNSGTVPDFFVKDGSCFALDFIVLSLGLSETVLVLDRSVRSAAMPIVDPGRRVSQRTHGPDCNTTWLRVRPKATIVSLYPT